MYLWYIVKTNSAREPVCYRTHVHTGTQQCCRLFSPDWERPETASICSGFKRSIDSLGKRQNKYQARHETHQNDDTSIHGAIQIQGAKYIHKRVSIRTTHYWYEYNVLLIAYQVYTSTQYWCSCSMNVSLECLYRLTPDTDGGDSKRNLESKPTYTRTGDECAEQDSARNGPSSIHTRHLSESPDGENIDTDCTTGLLLGCSHLIQLILLLQKLLPLLLPLLLHRLRVHRIILPGTPYYSPTGILPLISPQKKKHQSDWPSVYV